MRWFLVRHRVYCMFAKSNTWFHVYRMLVIHCELIRHIACSSNLLQVCCMFVERIVCSSNLWFVEFMTRWFASFSIHIFAYILIFDETENRCLLFDLRLVWSRFLAMKYLYEYNEDSFRAMKNKNDWFFSLDVLETIYDEKILHWRVSKSIYLRWFCNNCIQNNFIKSIDSNQLLKVFVQKTTATALVQEWYSYEADVNDLNWLSFKTVISWLEIWNETALNSTKSLIFKLISVFCFQNSCDFYSYHEIYCN